MYALFFPLGLIRPLLGYESIIGYNIQDHIELLKTSSILALIGLILFVSGVIYFNNIKTIRVRKNVELSFYSKPYINVFEIISLFFSLLSILIMIRFVINQGNIFTYLSNIDSMRSVLSGQMPIFGTLYLNVLLSLYLIFIKKSNGFISKFGIVVSIILFSVLGFRGPVLSILIILFFTLQKLKLFRIKMNLRAFILIGITIYLFVLTQDLRGGGINNEPFYLKILTRFNGYDPLMIIYDKVVLKDLFTIKTIYTNILSFIELPIPRDLLENKVPPVSVLLTSKLFYDIGYRSFSTGGISPTILGSLIWNFHVIGILFMTFLGVMSSYLENFLRMNNSPLANLFVLCLSIYFILSIEFPENSLGVLWLLTIGLFGIKLLTVFLKKIQ
jgi:hypothetical protein